MSTFVTISGNKVTASVDAKNVGTISVSWRGMWNLDVTNGPDPDIRLGSYANKADAIEDMEAATKIVKKAK